MEIRMKRAIARQRRNEETMEFLSTLLTLAATIAAMVTGSFGLMMLSK
jgi:hypothetical protein